MLGPNPLTLPAVQSEENLAADGIRGGSVLQAPCRSAGQPSAAQMPPRRCREAKSQLVSRLGFELVPVVSPTGTHSGMICDL